MSRTCKQYNTVIGWFVLIIMICVLMIPRPALAFVTPLDNTAVLNREDWLYTYGVNVYYTLEYQPGDTRFSAVDLPVRLFAERLGYPTDWGVSTPLDMKALVENGFLDLLFIDNGGTQQPQIGDVLIWNDHAAVINLVWDTGVQVVQQAKWTSYDDAGLPVSKEYLPLTSDGTNYLVADALGWVRSPIMQKLLQGDLDPIGISGDWDGDGKDTIGVYNPATSTFYLCNDNSYGRPHVQFAFGEPRKGWIPIAGDWDGDGVDTVGLYESDTGTYHLKNSNSVGVSDMSFVYGHADVRWLPVAADWNRDGRDTVGAYDQVDRIFYLSNSTPPTGYDKYFGYGEQDNNWYPLGGDWNGDRLDTIGTYVPDQSKFLLKNVNTFGNEDILLLYGDPVRKWYPLSGDWDGDGIDSVGVYIYQAEHYPNAHYFQLKDNNESGVEGDVFHYYLNHVVWIPFWTFTSPEK